MLVTVCLVVLVLAVLVYVILRIRALAKDVATLQTASEAYVTLDEWEGCVQPSLATLGEGQERLQRSLGVLSASVRGLREGLMFQDQGRGVLGASSEARSDLVDDTGEVDSIDGQEAGGLDAEEVEMLQTAQASEGNLQAMLLSVARLFQQEDVGGDPDASYARPQQRRGHPAASIAQARVVFGVPVPPERRPTSSTTIEEAPDDSEPPGEEEEEAEEDLRAVGRISMR